MGLTQPEDNMAKTQNPDDEGYYLPDSVGPLIGPVPPGFEGNRIVQTGPDGTGHSPGTPPMLDKLNVKPRPRK
jgi:hypothetical protein